MTKSEKSLFDRIGSVKNSLENAEQSFKDNKDVRGELDLMLAEAELKNLRRKKDFPWTWNRHALAICVACMVFFGGLIGWYCATDANQSASAKDVTSTEIPKVEKKVEQSANKNNLPDNQNLGKNSSGSVEVLENKNHNSSQVNITKNDMRRLVRSAREELSNSK